MPKVNVRISIEGDGNTVIRDKSAYILLDKSGSMGWNWLETVGAMNAYVEELAADETSRDTKVTLALFDTPVQAMDFSVLRKGVEAGDWKAVDPGEATPRGYTPLFDAIGRIVALAEQDKPERAVMVIITDGAENASRELTRGEAKEALDRCRARGWQVVFIGADFDAFGQAASVGGAVGQTISMNAGSYAATTKTLARKTREYASFASASVDFSDADRAEAAGKKAVKETGV